MTTLPIDVSEQIGEGSVILHIGDALLQDHLTVTLSWQGIPGFKDDKVKWDAKMRGGHFNTVVITLKGELFSEQSPVPDPVSKSADALLKKLRMKLKLPIESVDQLI